MGKNRKPPRPVVFEYPANHPSGADIAADVAEKMVAAGTPPGKIELRIAKTDVAIQLVSSRTSNWKPGCDAMTGHRHHIEYKLYCGDRLDCDSMMRRIDVEEALEIAWRIACSRLRNRQYDEASPPRKSTRERGPVRAVNRPDSTGMARAFYVPCSEADATHDRMSDGDILRRY